MGNWENIIKTDKYKFIYLPSFPFLFDKPVVSRRCESVECLPLRAPHTSWITFTTQRKASQARNRPKGCEARGPPLAGFRFMALQDLKGVVFMHD
ncbi:hypothetical protein AOG26_18030 [Pseudoalteromonas sp. UCD-33C]|nr:hypothetical protein AOG26_18030 [Pseudoalteromonas sp. UCD-33C]|tara:strand:+ start:499 stop:783 length:285 start_codon:yes stop_codon:yes gene_type:complete